MRKSVHVTYRKNDGMWHVTSGANGTSSGSYGTQKEAMKEGRKQAMEASAEFCVHGKDGKIRLSTSYGNDPSNSTGNKRTSSSQTNSERSRCSSNKSKKSN